MKEHDLRKIANLNMEFITPEKIRKWLAKKIHSTYSEFESVFDPAVGSGQLFQFIKSEKYIGCDINIDSLKCFSDNFENSEFFHGNYFQIDTPKNYEIAISNYPFSLNATELFDNTFEPLQEFYKNKISGKADFPFIILSFKNAKKGGFYLCYPGIAYRSQEQKFRDFLIKNNYVVSIGKLMNCKFDATNIDVLYLELEKNKIGETITIFTHDFENEGNYIEKTMHNDELLGENWVFPEKEKEKEVIDIDTVENELKKCIEHRRRVEDELDDFIHKTFKK